ncbi:MAG: helix-turn-helix domain-containing protein [Candidatus Tectomicrobia bacterium]|nr:helix-turn-helix domain-containing protein [Candidatus Tectomicrobia bacterium]
MNDQLEVVRGSGNVFRDFGDPDADIQQMKAILAGKIIGILDDAGLSVRQAATRTGIDHADFSRIRNADLERFTIDRLMKVLNRLNHRVQVEVSVLPMSEEVVAAK